MGNAYVASGATLSPDERYRYALFRRWATNPESPSLVVIGLNPSTADATLDDPTIRRCVGFAREWSFGGLVMLNLFAYRSTDPAGLLSVVDPVGPENDQALTEHTKNVVLCAWGAGGAILDRGPAVTRLLLGLGRKLTCLGTTKAGHPKHPLYLAANTRPMPFDGGKAVARGR